jgi:hypothetical protein
MEVKRAYSGVVCPRMMLTLVVSQIFLAGVPNEVIYSLRILICHPKISHFHRARSVAFDGIVCNTNGSGVIAMDGHTGLWMSEVFEGKAKN